MKIKHGIAAILTMGFSVLVSLPTFPSESKHNRRLVTIDDLLTIKYIDRHMDISPDGQTLAYVIDDDIWLVSINRAQSHRRIVKGQMPRWSPDGKHLAYYSTKSGVLQLWVWNFESGETSQITALRGGITLDLDVQSLGGGGDGRSFEWSPDGSKIVFSSRTLLKNVGGAQRDRRIHTRAPQLRDGFDFASAGSPLVLTNATPTSWTLRGFFPESKEPAVPPKA